MKGLIEAHKLLCFFTSVELLCLCTHCFAPVMAQVDGATLKL